MSADAAIGRGKLSKTSGWLYATHLRSRETIGLRALTYGRVVRTALYPDAESDTRSTRPSESTQMSRES